MTWISKIQQALDYIEAHLDEPITAESVGRAVHYAPSSIAGMFSAVTGYSIGEYVRFRRLSCAADALVHEKSTVTEAALSCGYESPEAFSKAFNRLFGCSPSQFASSEHRHRAFSPMHIDFTLTGGLHMTRSLIPGLPDVSWADTQRQNEYVNSVVSALHAMGEKLAYDDVCAVSGSAFRTSFSMPSSRGDWNHGNYHVINTPDIIGHTFRMLGYQVTQLTPGDAQADARRIMDSIDRGVPVITLEGVINCADACVISGYDADGGVLLGYSPFMHIDDDHDEAPDDTGYFRKSDWHASLSQPENPGRILLIGEPCGKPDDAAILAETARLAMRLIGEDVLVPGQHNGLAAHKAFANALLTYPWTDVFEPYLNLMCNYKQYLDRRYAAPFFKAHGQAALAACYEDIAAVAEAMGRAIPQDFSAGALFEDKANLKPYCDLLLQINVLEQRALALLEDVAGMR